MRTLMVQVSALDPHTEGALKVIEYYDTLVEHAATLEACTRASGTLSRCVVGLRDLESSWSVRFNASGLAVEGESVPSMKQAVRVETSVVGEVWLERPGPPEELDELILERFARAAGALWRRSPRAARSIGSLLQSLFSGEVAPEVRERALQRLGFNPSRPIDLAAVVADDVVTLSEQLTMVRDAVASSGQAGEPTACAVIGNVGAVITQSAVRKDESAPCSLPVDCRARIGLLLGCPTADLSEGWRKANTAARFGRMLGFGPMVDHRNLGALGLLAGLAPDLAAADGDVRRLGELAESRRGHQALQTLETFLVHDSVRQAAAAMFVHQSTLRYRIDQIEKALGFGLEDQQGRVRASVAVVVWRLLAR
ncbi:PucR family transcriptional regulator [Streptomyces sp. CA-249302]|uniref:PucR family transcriptional regulator n=1 Tax=Streptomyces sp. CA-249302 TaxID=3240058 RepID=UPI003D8B1F43